MMLRVLLLATCGLCAACDPENGEADPPLANLVPCNRDAAADDPLACPAALDASVATDAQSPDAD